MIGDMEGYSFWLLGVLSSMEMLLGGMDCMDNMGFAGGSVAFCSTQTDPQKEVGS